MWERERERKRKCVCVREKPHADLSAHSFLSAHFPIQSSTFLFSHPLLHLWVQWPLCQGHGNKSRLTSCSAFTSICSCSYLKATAVGVQHPQVDNWQVHVKSGPSTFHFQRNVHTVVFGTQPQRPQLSCHHLQSIHRLILTKPISWHQHATMPLKHEHRTLLGYLNIWGIPSRCSKWRRFILALTFLSPCINFLVVLHVEMPPWGASN